jgi:CRP-like cAMP-binding protein
MSLRNYPAMSAAPPDDRATFPLFGSLTEADAASVRSLLRRRQVEAGATVSQRGDVADAVYLIVSGQLRISVGSANGRELAFRVIGSGDMVGEMGVLDGGSRSADLTALRQSVMLGLSRPTVNIAFRELEQHGAIRRTGRKLQCRIHVLEDLAEISDP